MVSAEINSRALEAPPCQQCAVMVANGVGVGAIPTVKLRRAGNQILAYSFPDLLPDFRLVLDIESQGIGFDVRDSFTYAAIGDRLPLSIHRQKSMITI